MDFTVTVFALIVIGYGPVLFNSVRSSVIRHARHYNG